MQWIAHALNGSFQHRVDFQFLRGIHRAYVMVGIPADGTGRTDGQSGYLTNLGDNCVSNAEPQVVVTRITAYRSERQHGERANLGLRETGSLSKPSRINQRRNNYKNRFNDAQDGLGFENPV